jgi:hypothetical protein
MKKLLLILIILFLAGCGSSSSTTDEAGTTTDTGAGTTTDPTADAAITYTASNCGAQKGPMQPGSTVGIGPVDSNMEPAGDYFPTSTEGWFGKFDIGSTFTQPYVSTTVSGYYLVENTGQPSGSQITLKAYSDLSVSSKIIVNLLTTLSYNRIKYLVVDKEQTITSARTQAEEEVLAVFKIYIDLVDSFDQMDIAVDDEKGGILLAVSAIIQQGNSDAEVSSLIYDISLDIKEDGTLDHPALISELAENAKAVDLAAIKTNVESYYAANGNPITLSKYIDYIDSDGDGIINLTDDNIPDAFSFAPVSDKDISTLYESAITISGITGTLLVTGSAYHNGVEKTNFSATNGDEIKLSLTSSPKYSTAVSTSATIAGVEYTYTVTTKADDRQQIIVFDSGQAAQDGDFGFANAQTWCSAEATVQSLTGTIIPYLSNDAIGVGDLGTESFSTKITEDSVNPRKVQSLAGGLIASRWSKFFDNENTDSFATLGVTDSDYWTGMASSSSNKGRTTYNCNQWTSNGDGAASGLAVDHANINTHTVGNRTINDPRGIETRYCNQTRKILCIAF